MPLINESYDSLPYIDTPLPEPDLTAAKAAIAAELTSTAAANTPDLHPSLLPAAQYTPTFSPLIEREHARLDANPASKLSAIDLTRYQETEAPPTTTPTTDEDKPALLNQWNTALKQAYTNSEYIQERLTQLGLLEKFGKNAWLIGNAQLEDILRGIEAELADVRKQQEKVEELRRAQQESVGGEMRTLEETWKKGVGRVLETQVAAEGLKQQILERRRAGAV